MEQGLKNNAAEEVEEEATEEEAEEPVIPTETLKVMDVIPVNIERVYKNWLNSEKHSAFTGGKARIKPVEESDFSAWDTYIVGEILELDYAKEFIQLGDRMISLQGILILNVKCCLKNILEEH